jgi:hypothetical protein
MNQQNDRITAATRHRGQLRPFARATLALAALVLIAAVAFGGGNDEEPGDELVSIGADGFSEVTQGEYRLQWKVAGAELQIRMSAPTTGWLAVGFDPSSAMRDANIILAAVVDGEVVTRDDHGNALFTHLPDTEQGGTDDVRAIGGSEEGGRTTVELAIPLDSGDQFDRPLEPGGSHTIIWAYGLNVDDEFSRQHVARGSFDVTL